MQKTEVQVTLLRQQAGEVMDQFRGMVKTPVVRAKLVLTAETQEQLNAMVQVAVVDGWRRAKT